MRKDLRELCIEEKAHLLLGNCFVHPSEENLISDDGKITAKFFQANVTSLILPMDQGHKTFILQLNFEGIHFY